MSPLGKYAAPAAAGMALLLVLGYMAAVILGGSLGINHDDLLDIRALAFMAAGAVFGSAVAVNGYKKPLDAVHKRLDRMGAPPAEDGEG